MRHNKKNTSTFGLKPGPRKALLRNLVISLVDHERVKTTLQKAKTIRPMIEKAITAGRKGGVSSYRLLLSKYPNRKAVSKIVKQLSPRFKDRPGGYTRIVKLGIRKGDASPKALIEFVDYKFIPRPTKEEKEKQKASPEYNKARKLKAQKVEAKRKVIRKIQSESRRINR
ncbi:MAG: 50S ribosomal protein L17 [Bdellovibrionales bacterium]